MEIRTSVDLMLQPSAAPRVRECDRVRLTRDLLVSEGSFAAGSTGTVVYVHKEGAAFEIEFTAPIQTVVTIESADLERLND